MSKLSSRLRPKRDLMRKLITLCAALIVLALPALFAGGWCGGFEAVAAPSQAVAPDEPENAVGVDEAEDVSLENRIRRIEEVINSVKMTTEMAEIRSYQNKMMGRELVRLVRAAVVVLVLIGIGFPLILLFLSYKRVLGPPGLSSEVAATLLEVEERQAKLTNILRDIQGEMDYLHTMSVPDLKRLIEQAESYIEQNERDLAETDARRLKSEGGAPKKPGGKS